MKYIEKMFRSFGTILTIQIGIRDEEQLSVEEGKMVLKEIKQTIEKMDDLFSTYKPDSEISRLNQMAGKGEVAVSKETFEILHIAKELQKQTDGNFDISLQALIDLWGIGKKNDFIPQKKDIDSLLQERSEEYLILDEKRQTAFLTNQRQKIDLGSIAKGYAVDKTIRFLKKKEVKEAIINFGGTIYAIGNPKKIGIQNPFQKTGIYLGTLVLEDMAAVTSGFYEQYFTKNKRDYHHILNPKTGNPVDNSLASITLIGKHATDLDAITTAVYVLGIEAGSTLLNDRKLEGIFVLKTGEVFHTKGLNKSFSLNEKDDMKQKNTTTMEVFA